MEVVSRKKKAIILIIALLLHLFLLFLIFFIYKLKDSYAPIIMAPDQTTAPNAVDAPAPEQQTMPDWASLRPSASNFGAPVIMHDESPATIQDQPPAPDIQSQEHEDVPETQEIKEVQESQDITQKPVAQEIDQPIMMPAIPDTLVPQWQAKPEKSNTQEEVKQESAKPRPLRKKRQKKNNQSNKQITLADVTRGFLNHVKNEGSNLIRLYGNDNATPNEEQLKYERYFARLAWNMQNAWNIKKHELQLQKPVETDIDLTLTIGADGKLSKLVLVRSCGMTSVDTFLCKVIEYAGSSFPPLPSFIKEIPYQMPWRINIYILPNSTTQFSIN
jgi:outer membrane biosynthesis protein TonB